jgi:hypothetical protein
MSSALVRDLAPQRSFGPELLIEWQISQAIDHPISDVGHGRHPVEVHETRPMVVGAHGGQVRAKQARLASFSFAARAANDDERSKHIERAIGWNRLLARAPGLKPGRARWRCSPGWC